MGRDAGEGRGGEQDGREGRARMDGLHDEGGSGEGREDDQRPPKEDAQQDRPKDSTENDEKERPVAIDFPSLHPRHLPAQVAPREESRNADGQLLDEYGEERGQ